MRDTPGDMTATVVCPACGSENVETLPGEGAAGTPEYRCLDCGNEFTASGEPAVSDSDTLSVDTTANPVACPDCGSENTDKIAVRALTYRCGDCNKEFGVDGGPME